VRILQLHAESREPGGADAVMEHEAAILRRAGHSVRRYTAPPVPDKPGPSHALDLVWNRAAYAAVSSIASTFNPEVVHVHAPYPRLSPSVFRAATAAGAATVTTLHNYRPACPVGTFFRAGEICTDCLGKVVKTPAVSNRCYHNSLGASAAIATSIALHRRTFMRHVHRYLALTEFGRDLLISDGIPADRIGVCPNSVADPGVNEAGRPHSGIVLFAGRLVPEKGIELLLDAWSSVTGGQLIIAGDGPLRGRVERACREDASIRLEGWVGQQELRDLYRRAELLVFPSTWHEGQPLGILQASAHGIPTLCSDLPAITQTAACPVAGVSFRTGSSDSLSKGLNRLLSDPDVMRMRGKAARRHYVQHHRPEDTESMLTQHYRAAQQTRRTEG